MITRYTDSGWEVILQRNHGLLAGEICGRWKFAAQPQRWIEILVACAGHDDAFNELEECPLLTSKGGPLNFDMNPFDERLSSMLVNMAISRSSFTALLISKHIHFTHGKEPEAKKFLKALKAREKEWIEVANTTTKEVDATYELLEFCDALSLLICQDIIQADKRYMEISKGPDGIMYSVTRNGNELNITPWPFNAAQFEVSYELRKLKKLIYANEEEFKEELYETKPHSIAILIKKAD